MDTSRSTKILMAEKSVKELEKYIGNFKEVKKSGVLKNLSAKILELKYSYGEPEDLKPFLEEIKKYTMEIYTYLGGKNIVETLKKRYFDEMRIATVRFALNILYNLDSRLHLPEDPAYAVDIRLGEIMSVGKHPNADRLKICNVDIGRMITVVTNISSVKEGCKLPVALLPPAEFRGVVSDGMFLSDRCRETGENGSLPELSEDELNNARKEVLSYLH
ncbi:MAG: tRNA-binding protein [Euryarchaeota archaeon]|nr:tRNA-binding protein [Euryarchaeota archaeon]